jgi:hypothetical protein
VTHLASCFFDIWEDFFQKISKQFGGRESGLVHLQQMEGKDIKSDHKSALRESNGAVFNLGPKTGSYVWVTGHTLPHSSRGLILFEAKAQNDIHISLNKNTLRAVGQDGLAEEAPVYEIVVGGWMNSKTAIRKQGMQQAYVSKRANPDAAINPVGEFCKYWVKLESGLISIGKGSDHSRNEIIHWQDDNPPPEIRFIGFR